MIGSSSGEASTSMRSVSFRTSHMEDPWILSTPNTSSEPIVTNVLLPRTMVAYQANIECVVEANIECVTEPSPSPSQIEEKECCLHGKYSLLTCTTVLIVFFL